MSGQDYDGKYPEITFTVASLISEMIFQKDPTGLWFRRWFRTRQRRLDRWSNVRRAKRTREVALRRTRRIESAGRGQT